MSNNSTSSLLSLFHTVKYTSYLSFFVIPNHCIFFVYFCYETLNLTVISNFIGVKMTIKCEYDSVVGVIMPVEKKILPILHLKLKWTKTHPLFYTFCCVFAGGKNGSSPNHYETSKLLKILFRVVA